MPWHEGAAEAEVCAHLDRVREASSPPEEHIHFHANSSHGQKRRWARTPAAVLEGGGCRQTMGSALWAVAPLRRQLQPPAAPHSLLPGLCPPVPSLGGRGFASVLEGCW